VVALVKLEAFSKAKEACEKVLQADPKNIKALYQKGKILIQEKDYDDALNVLKLADSLEPNNPLVMRELKAVEIVLAQKESQIKNMYNRMMGAPKAQKEVKHVEIIEEPDEEEPNEEADKSVGIEQRSTTKAAEKAKAKEAAEKAAEKAKEAAKSKELGNPGKLKRRRKERTASETAGFLAILFSMLLLILYAVMPRDDAVLDVNQTATEL